MLRTVRRAQKCLLSIVCTLVGLHVVQASESMSAASTRHFMAQQQLAAEGDENSCKSVEGIYKLTIGSKNEKIIISYVHQGLMMQLGAHKYLAMARVDSATNEKEIRGLLIETHQGWFLTLLAPGVTAIYPSMFEETSIFPAFEDYYVRHKTPPQGTRVYKIEFNSDTSYGFNTSEDLLLAYESNETLQAFLTAHTDPVPFLSRLSDTSLRIPLKMYDVLEDPEFLKARESRHYTKMYDIIFEQALRVSNGDIEKALFISLLTTDLRDRGPCGAIRGPRGRTLVPIGIFDKEVPEASVIGSRLDAAQHFFGYAILAYKFGREAVTLFSEVSKSELRKLTGRFFRHLHIGGEPDFDETDGKGFPFASIWYQGKDLRLRPKHDLLADKHYNRLGIEFAHRLQENAQTTPSSVINDIQFGIYESEIGLPPTRQTPWTVDPPETRITTYLPYFADSMLKLEVKVVLPDQLKINSNYNRLPVYLYDGFERIEGCDSEAIYIEEDSSLYIHFFRSKVAREESIISTGSDEETYAACEKFTKARHQKYILDYRGHKYFFEIRE